jgi:hypothetical protein
MHIWEAEHSLTVTLGSHKAHLWMVSNNVMTVREPVQHVTFEVAIL